MKFFTKKRIVLFLLFIFPLICFLILSTGKNNFTKLPILTKNVLDITDVNPKSKVTFKDHVSVVCFLGNTINSSKTRVLNLNEKIYKKFFDYKKFQTIAFYPNNKAKEVDDLKVKLSEFTDMLKWKFIPLDKAAIEGIYESFSTQDSLHNLSSNSAFIIDKNVNLRGRVDDEDTLGGKMYGYNMNSIAELKNKMKDDISVLFYEYYAAFKVRNKNKADRKEVGL